MTIGYRKTYRSHLMAGIRQRIERESLGRRLLVLWSWLMDAYELPA